MLSSMGGSVVRQTRSLGNDLTLMNVRATQVQQQRMHDLAGKTKRLLYVTESKHPVKQVFGSGLKNGAIYGCEITEINGTALTRLQAAAIRAAGVNITGAMHDIIWAALGTGSDPKADIRWAPLERYHREWWLSTSANRPEDVLTPPQLVAAFELADQDRAQQDDARRRQVDPVAMAIHGAWTVGWKFTNANTIDINGVSLSLLMTSPAGLKRIYKEHYQKMVDFNATRSLVAQVAENTKLPVPDNIPILPWNIVRTRCSALMKRKRRKEVTQLIRIVSGTVITGDYITKISGNSTECPRCAHEIDDLHHRLYRCPAGAHERSEYFRPSLIRHNPTDVTQHIIKYCGLLPIPTKLLPGGDFTTLSSPAWPHQHQVDIRQVFDHDHGAAYTDASGYFATDLYFSRVAIAMVQMSPSGNILGAWGTTMPQQLTTHPAMGEQMAAFIYCNNFENAHIVTDCQAVIANLQNPKHAAHPRNPAAGAWRQLEAHRWPTFNKVKAHRSWKRAQLDGDTADWAGNKAADEWAKEVALRDMPRNWVKKVNDFKDKAKNLLAAHVVMHAGWPTPPQKWWKPQTTTEVVAPPAAGVASGGADIHTQLRQAQAIPGQDLHAMLRCQRTGPS